MTTMPMILALAGACTVQATSAAQPAPAPAPLRPAGMASAAPMPRLPMPALQTGNRNKKMGDDLECLLEPHMVVNVGSPVEGTLSEVLLDRGDLVSKGQVVARLNSGVEESTLELRKSQQEFGKRKVARNEELFRKDLIALSEKDELESQAKVAALEYQQQQQVVSLRTIRSPINGVVVERFLAPGEHVSQEKIMKLAQIDPLKVEVIAPVEMFGMIRKGMVAEVRLDPLVDGVFKASVTVIDRVIDPASMTFGVRLALPNPARKVPSGIKCRVRFYSGPK